MEKTLQQLMQDAIAMKRGDTEFALSYYGPDSWSAGIGNKCLHVHVMETGPKFEGNGKTPEEAVRSLIDEMRRAYDEREA